MKTFSLSFILMYISVAAVAQNDTEMSNSFSDYYNKNHISIKYNYIASKQTHDYSGNWDFDGDGKPDDLLFVGNGGVHLYFHLRIKLSADSTPNVKDYPFISTDMPVLIHAAKNGNSLHDTIGFTVNDSNADGKSEILVYLDKASEISKAERKKKSPPPFKKVLLQFKDGKSVIRTVFPNE